MRQSMVKLPNRLILDNGLSLSARRVAAVLYSRRNALGLCHKSLNQLSGLAGLSVATVRKALAELDEGGYITRQQTYRFHTGKNMPVYGKSAYQCSLDFSGGFTMVPRTLLTLSMSDSSFAICLFLYFSAGNRNRAFPSISRIAASVGIARSTVCRALKQLKQLPILLVQLCKKTNRAFTSSSYIFTKTAGFVPAVSMQADTLSRPGLLTRLQDFLRGVGATIKDALFRSGVVSFLANYD